MASEARSCLRPPLSDFFTEGNEGNEGRIGVGTQGLRRNWVTLRNFATFCKNSPSFSSVLVRHSALRLVNVNLPPEPKGIRWTRQSIRQYDGRMVQGKDPDGSRDLLVHRSTSS